MFTWWGRAVVTLRWGVLALGFAIVAVGATWGAGVFDHLTDGGFYNENSPSIEANKRIEDTFGRQGSDVVVIYESKNGNQAIDHPAFAKAVNNVVDELLTHREVSAVASYYNTQSPVFVTEDLDATFIAVTLSGNDDAERAKQYEKVSQYFEAEGLTDTVGGQAAVFDDINTQTQSDVLTAELISLPILLILMIVIFGSVVAATTPLVIGIIAIMGGFIITRVLTMMTDVSVFAINVITIIGLGLSIDYALFIVNRFREERRSGRNRKDIIVRTMRTAGRTVMVSGLAIVLSLAGLLIFPLPFLHGIAYGGMAAVIVAMLGAMTVLPALLTVLGHRIDAVKMPWRKTEHAGSDTGMWSKIGASVMKRPYLYMIGVLGILLALASPFLQASFGGVDENVLPEGTESRVALERIREDFPGGDLTTIDVMVDGGGQETLNTVTGYMLEFEIVQDVIPVANKDGATLLNVTIDSDDQSQEARDVARKIVDQPVPNGVELSVSGMPLILDDQIDEIGERLPWLALYVAVVTFLLLFLAFGSVILPIKAILMNVISIGASFGIIVWVFQEGHFAGLFGFTPSGHLEPSNLLLMVVLLFGLSTDYEVFLLSRVREEWDHHKDNTRAVLTGMQRTGSIITSAAILLIVVVAAFAAGGISMLKMIGIGMAVAILIDATLVRLLLVPATMRILGKTSWWAPKPLQRFYAKHGIKENDTGPDTDADMDELSKDIADLKVNA